MLYKYLFSGIYFHFLKKHLHTSQYAESDQVAWIALYVVTALFIAPVFCTAMIAGGDFISIYLRVEYNVLQLVFVCLFNWIYIFKINHYSNFTKKIIRNKEARERSVNYFRISLYGVSIYFFLALLLRISGVLYEL